MGLDITVHKLKKVSEKDIENHNFFRLISENGNEDLSDFPKWSYKFKTKNTEQWFDWDKLKEEKGFDISKYDYVGESYGDNGYILSFRNKETKEDVNINADNIPTYDNDVTIIGYEEVGYQRKGLNSKFYEDYNSHKIGYYVWTLDELKRYLEEYCDEDRKECFQENIIDKFVEGECCVTFDW